MDLFPSSDLWWRYFIYGAIFHIFAASPLSKTDKVASLARFLGYAVAVIPVILKEGILSGVWMTAFLYGLTVSINYVKSIFSKD